MTSLMTEMDSQMVALILFWGVVVVALVITSAAGEIRPPAPFDIGRGTVESEPDRTNVVQLRPASGARIDAGTRAAGRSTSARAVRSANLRPV